PPAAHLRQSAQEAAAGPRNWACAAGARGIQHRPGPDQ
nr:hypothetical protein [Tanacetum cinerariifolium]